MSTDKSYELWNNHVQNQTKKIQFILVKYSYTINSKHKGFTALEYAIMNGNVEKATTEKMPADMMTKNLENVKLCKFRKQRYV